MSEFSHMKHLPWPPFIKCKVPTKKSRLTYHSMRTSYEEIPQYRARKWNLEGIA